MNPKEHQPGSLPAPAPEALAQSGALSQHIRTLIEKAGGWLRFDRYMEQALYAPGLGYYSGGSIKFGRRSEDGSDFITAPELSPLFATTLAQPVAQALAQSHTRNLLEFGAGTGQLAAGLLNALAAHAGEDQANLPFDSYSIVDLSGELRERQRATIEAQAPALASRVRWLDTLPERFEGVVLGNEVLDAMPVRLFAQTDGIWHERGVTLADDGTLTFSDRALDASRTPDAPDAPPGHDNAALLAEIETDGTYLTETHDAARAFTHTVCTMLTRGAAFFFDYGFPRHEYYHPQRAQGTLMCHYRHRAHGDPFVYPGLQDITAHIDFTGIALAGTEAGADLLGYTSQARFLLNAGITEALATIDPNDTRRYLPAANALQKLLSEAEMGELFKVIAFSRGIDGMVDAFARGDRSHTL
ncbi:class I SAM-dependent methyltransferase [Paraburkholderia hayleyella]|uniref:class I SAM-dependent methyltransferase n=1 Tax=Paraburkholderia hayleyella TaxID=2152889 RepID=UPI00129132D2|nr:SAM-dependent methyltransferase [Paraburkholderia hayleyella]